MKLKPLKYPVLILLGLTSGLSGAEFHEGSLSLMVKRGESEQSLLYTRKGHQLRIEYPGKHIPAKPYNLIDLESGDLTIVRPLNSTWAQIPAEQLTLPPPSTFPQPPSVPAGIGARPGPPGAPGTPPMTPEGPPSSASDRRTPLPPSGVSAPRIPSVTLPDGSPLPGGIGPRPGTGTSSGRAGDNPTPTPHLPKIDPPAARIPNHMPAIPGGVPAGIPMFHRNSQKPELTETKETRTIHGYQCQRHVMMLPAVGEMTLWLTDANDLPPFHLPIHQAPRTTGRVTWMDQWPAILREQELFPMLAILRLATEGDTEKEGPEIARWQVTHISIHPVDDQQGALFMVPENFHEPKAADHPLPFEHHHEH